MKKILLASSVAFLSACGGAGGGSSTDLVDLGISPSASAGANSSYRNSRPDIYIAYSSLPRPSGTGSLNDAIAYLDADGDGDTDVFMATGDYLLQGEVNSILALNNGNNQFTSDTAAFGGNMPPATHARKSLVSDFNGDGLQDILVLDHGYDANPFPGAQPKLILQDSAGSFSWSKLPDTGFHHGGAAADIDNDGDIDIFVGGFDPFFYINDGNAAFTRVTNRFDQSISKIFSAELIDVDQDGFIDLLVGAHERDGDKTSIYWGSSTGSYGSANRTVIPAVANFGAVLDFDAEDVDGDGDLDLIINRTRDGDDGPAKGFYMGRTLQLLINNGGRSFSDETAQRIDQPGGDSDSWFPWLRVQDVDGDGDVDMAPDDAGKTPGQGWVNDGSGNFSLQSL